MRALRLKYDQTAFWRNIWAESAVDPSSFRDPTMYPIFPTQKYLNRSDRILECGFGAGRVYRHLVNAGYARVVGLEYDLAIAQRVRRVQPGPLVSGSITSLPFPDHGFDKTLAFGVLSGLEHDFRKGLDELVRVTRPGGYLVVSLMLDNLSRVAQGALDRWGPAPGPARFYAWMDTLQGWGRYLGAVGLTIVDTALMSSRYNFYAWTPWLRSRTHVTDPALARVDDREWRLNPIGEILFRLSRWFVPSQWAGAGLFVCHRA